MRVLLISANTEQINVPVLPLGTAFIATAVQKAGHEIKLVNLMGDLDALEQLRNGFYGFEPEVIGISVRNIDDQSMQTARFLLDPVKEIIDACRNLSEAPIVLGGAGYSIFPESALQYLGADMGIQGEGEQAFIALLDRFGRRDDVSTIPGLFMPNSGSEVKLTPSRNLDGFDLPLPDAHPWIPPSAIDNRAVSIPIQTRRGCPLDCNYCSTAAIEGRITRRYSPDKVHEALIRYIDAGYKRFQFVDNTFNFPPSYAEALCDQIIKAELDMRWMCILYPSKVTENLAEKMARAGCRGISLGFESGSEKILQIMNKKFTTDEVRRISAMFKKQNIFQMGFLLLGGPGETRGTVEDSLAFADSLDLDSVKITVGIRIYPHTALASTAVEEGIISSEDELLYPKFYISKGLEGWLKEVVAEWAVDRPHWLI